MGVSETTADIAATISQVRAPLSSREAQLLLILQGMPYYRDIRRLDLFDTAYREIASEPVQSETERLIDALFWLGADCFYGEYSEASTRNYYDNTLVPLFAKAGVPLPESPNLSSW
jgi:hypothetical protein